MIIAVVRKSKVHVKFQTKFDYKEVPRVVLIDAHTVLSRDGLLIHDASLDWRTRKNPFVTSHPQIRFYCGVNLANADGVVFGTLAVFRGLSKLSFPQEHKDLLSLIAADFVKTLDTPYEVVAETTRKELLKGPFSTNAELAELNCKLGRATSSGGYLTIFEKDGSGSPYSRDHKFKLAHYNESKQITQSRVPLALKSIVRQKLKKATSVREASRIFSELVTSHFKIDYFALIEVRFLESVLVPGSVFSESQQKVFLSDHKDLKIESDESRKKCYVKLLVSQGGKFSVDSFDTKVWYKAIASDTGFQLAHGSPKHRFDTGVIIPVHKSKITILAKNKAPHSSETVEANLRSGGFLVAALNKSSEAGSLSQTVISQLFDFVQITCRRYLKD